MRWGRWRCRNGHSWLLAGRAFEFVCIEDQCMRCGAISTIHATCDDELTACGLGGCVHGMAGVRSQPLAVP